MLIFFILAVIGLTNTVNHGKIMDIIRLRPWLKDHLSEDLYEATKCPECVGWWAGLIMGILLISFNPLVFLPCAFAGSGICHCYSTVMLLIESKVEYVLVENNDEQQK